ncbi:ABC transporter substrate-binding protein [Roseomonas frigidaquae]|uniref:ABC transporter substrate-binding protein n=1 Tax=Falsiroseomonas frigidaquae TaxID=487318 RepID=A0ABX1F5P6_9PROT|nr:ABC transporter substrate-binding protein [Falsiroseomonas frigidaquae]NKE47590.1 ABC transporter substrate-binding protein [Falsiroseomonas frigidaquae]
MTKLTLACTRSDRTQPILDGRIAIGEQEIIATAGEPEDLFRIAMRDAQYDITELSMASHILSVARGDSRYIGVPVYPSRAFRHSAIYIRTDRGITGPKDLAGRTIGVPEYQQTAAMWVRGMMRTYYGVPMSTICWRSAGERTPLSLPPGIDMQVIPEGETLEGMLAEGRIDAFIGPRPPACFLDGSAPVARLFPNSRAEEEAYCRATGFFPIMHCIAIRRTLAEDQPGLAMAVFNAFTAAKDRAVADLSLGNVLRVSLPWIVAEAAAQTEMMGGDPWPYGFTRNRAELDAMCRYAKADGLTAHPVAVEELFERSTHGT